jgi:hypothetical protein
MKKSSNHPNYDKHLNIVTRSLINSTLSCIPLDEKLVMARAAIMSKKIRPSALPLYEEILTSS